MNVLAINASPHKIKDNTARILSPFLEGMSAAGADTELICTSALQIHPCSGRGFPQQQGNSTSFSHFLSGLISLAVSDTSGMKAPDRISITITPKKSDDP